MLFLPECKNIFFLFASPKLYSKFSFLPVLVCRFLLPLTNKLIFINCPFFLFSQRVRVTLPDSGLIYVLEIRPSTSGRSSPDVEVVGPVVDQVVGRSPSPSRAALGSWGRNRPSERVRSSQPAAPSRSLSSAEMEFLGAYGRMPRRGEPMLPRSRRAPLPRGAPRMMPRPAGDSDSDSPSEEEEESPTSRRRRAATGTMDWSRAEWN